MIKKQGTRAAHKLSKLPSESNPFRLLVALNKEIICHYYLQCLKSNSVTLLLVTLTMLFITLGGEGTLGLEGWHKT